jgi:hypothetical protein
MAVNPVCFQVGVFNVCIANSIVLFLIFAGIAVGLGLLIYLISSTPWLRKFANYGSFWVTSFDTLLQFTFTPVFRHDPRPSSKQGCHHIANGCGSNFGHLCKERLGFVSADLFEGLCWLSPVSLDSSTN